MEKSVKETMGAVEEGEAGVSVGANPLVFIEAQWTVADYSDERG